jgi:5'-nucleotidase
MLKRLCFDMDNVLVDFQSGIDKLPEDVKKKYEGCYDEVTNIFSTMEPYEGAIEAFNVLCLHYDCHIVSTAPWDNPQAWKDKLLWVKKHLGNNAYKRLTLTHNKNLIDADYIIDDRTANGVDKFKGEHIHFGTESFPDWECVLNYLLKKNSEDK